PDGNVLGRRRRHNLRDLDKERGRVGHRWSSRPHRTKAHQAHAVLELLAWHARLQSGSVEVYWWRRSDLLLRRQLKLAAGPHASWPGLASATYVALQHRSLKITASPRRRGDRVKRRVCVPPRQNLALLRRVISEATVRDQLWQIRISLSAV